MFVAVAGCTGILLVAGAAAYNLLDDADYETSAEATYVIANEIIKSGKSHGRLLDLGSSYGSFAIRLKLLVPTLEIISVEKSPVRYLIAQLRCILKIHKPKFVLGNYVDYLCLRADFKNIYLPRELIRREESILCNKAGFAIIFMYRVELYRTAASNTIFLSNYSADDREVVRFYDENQMPTPGVGGAG